MLKNPKNNIDSSIYTHLNVYRWRNQMRTNIVLNDELVEQALSLSDNIKTKRELIEKALEEYVSKRMQKNISEIKGKIQFADQYDYKAMRKNKL
jgi:Arc/MetJ family transcription regulator